MNETNLNNMNENDPLNHPPWVWKPKEAQNPENPEKEPTLHDQLWAVCQCLPTDFEPYGTRKRDETINGEEKWYQDCSCGCKFFKSVEGKEGMDWGVCYNENSPRKGLLTFEHQGCPKFELDLEEEIEEIEEI